MIVLGHDGRFALGFREFQKFVRYYVASTEPTLKRGKSKRVPHSGQTLGSSGGFEIFRELLRGLLE